VLRSMAAVFVVLALCSCTMRARRPDGPYREAEEFVDALSDEAVDCTKEHAPSGEGKIIVVADISRPGEVPAVQDAGSSEGVAAVIDCVRERVAQKLKSPRKAPAPYAQVKLPLPLVTSKVTYAFVKELPPSGS
jgi:hypothetical protein